MKIRGFSWLLLFPIVIASLVELGIVLKLDDVNSELNEITNQRRSMRKLSEEMRMTSEFLTRFSRRYVLKKDPKVHDWYNQILDIRDGKIAKPGNYNTLYWDLVSVGLESPPDIKNTNGIPLTTEFSRVSFSNIATQKLIESKTKSDALSRMESIAMHAINGEYDDGTGSFKILKKPDERFATKIITDDAYLQAKAEVVKPLADVARIIDEESKEKIDELEKTSTTLTQIQTLLSLGLLFWATLGAFYLYKRVALRLVNLDKAVKAINRGNFTINLQTSGRDEIGQVGETLNKLIFSINDSFKELESKSTALEGVSKELQIERDQTEKLLYNILPAVIASRIRNGEEMIAETYPEVTVFFADIVDFTTLSSSLGPHQTVNMLNDIFGKFDALAEEFKIEKIKTIGDCYMAVAGMPSRDPFHCQHVAQFALAALKIVTDMSANNPFQISVRIGIHTGTVAAGIVGKKKFSYELWGDVVNIANRFEGSSKPDSIHVSDTVRIRLNDDYYFEQTHDLEIKGKGSFPTYYLIAKKENHNNIIDIKSRIGN